LFVLALMVSKIIIVSVLAGIAVLAIALLRKTRKNIITISVILALAAGVVFSVDYFFHNVLEPHQKQRINVLLGKDTDLKGAGYNVNQSLIAIGSGGITGKGFLNGTQTKFDFVPEQSTDFIFCTVGEEWGFLGSLVILGLFTALLYRILFIAERQKSDFTRIYAYGVASILFIHLMVNIGMTIGLLPVIGIPLPFLSYGGSSLWSFTILLFILVKLDSYRTFILR
jgi:rod shape determining protein RodA